MHSNVSFYWADRIVEMRRQELEREAEQYRRAACLSTRRDSGIRHMIAGLGGMLVKAGMRLERVELQGEPQGI